MIIEGKVSELYNNYTIYLVPQPYSNSNKVDSTKITNGKFNFKIPIDFAPICEITISKKANAHIQKLLVAVEPGILHAIIDTTSSSYGTPLNDDLQHWKELMALSGEEGMKLSKKIKENTDEQIIGKLEQDKEKIYQAFGDSTFSFILRNQNHVGGFIYMATKNNFDSIQRKLLQESGIGERVPIRKQSND